MEVVRYCGGSVFYKDLGRKPNTAKVYGEGVIVVTVAYFKNWEIKVKEKVTDNKGLCAVRGLSQILSA